MKIINLLISKIKKQEFFLDENIKFTNLAQIISDRFISLLRINKRIGLQTCGKIVFWGKGVKLKHKNYIVIGNGVTIDNYVEIDALSKNGVVIGDNVKVGSYTIIKCTGTLKKIGKGLKIGSNSGVGEFSFFGAAGGIEIGENVIMGQNIRFHSENHNFEEVDIPIKEQGVTNKGIRLGNDCWIGAGTVFLDGVTVGDGCVIGANTLVNKDIPSFSIAVGNPVKIINSRKNGIVI